MSLAEFIFKIDYIFKILFIVSLILFSYRLIYIFFAFKKQKPPKKTKKKAKFAILIPARDESNVIEKLLQSIKAQTYNKEYFDVYVITEDEFDLTNKITESYGYNYFVRKDLENKRTKGFALNEVLQDIYSKKLKYDAFIIFDADNMLKENFIEEMNNLFWSGIDVGTAYRNSINFSDNWVASCSSLLFSNINTFQNKARNFLFNTTIISGTGYFISSKIIDEFKGFPFTELTEDFEISTYLALKNIKTKYITSTEFYDEQPTSLKTLSKQRVRWIKGYLNVNKKYKKQTYKTIFSKKRKKAGVLELKFSLIPNVVFISSFLSYFLIMFGCFFVGVFTNNVSIINTSLINVAKKLLLYQIFIDGYTLIQLIAERKKLRIKLKDAINCLVFNPFFVALFINHAIKAVFTKNIVWKKVEHTCENVVLNISQNEKSQNKEIVKENIKKEY